MKSLKYFFLFFIFFFLNFNEAEAQCNPAWGYTRTFGWNGANSFGCIANSLPNHLDGTVAGAPSGCSPGAYMTSGPWGLSCPMGSITTTHDLNVAGAGAITFAHVYGQGAPGFIKGLEFQYNMPDMSGGQINGYPQTVNISVTRNGSTIYTGSVSTSLDSWSTFSVIFPTEFQADPASPTGTTFGFTISPSNFRATGVGNPKRWLIQNLSVWGRGGCGCPCSALSTSGFASGQSATCTSGTPNNNASLVLSPTGSLYQYNAGSSFNVGAATPAIPVSIPGDGIVVNTLANPAVSQTYTARIYNPSNTYCYVDATTTITNNDCICLPSASVTAAQSTCTGTTANSNGNIIVNSYSGGLNKVGYSYGGTYTGATYASATTLGAAPFTIVNTLPNPAYGVTQPYSVRVFKRADCYLDFAPSRAFKNCSTADLSLSVSPVSDTKNQNESSSYVVTLTNAGPNSAVSVKARVPTPSNGTLLAAVPSQGSYDPLTGIWTVGTVAVGSQTLTFTVKVN